MADLDDADAESLDEEGAADADDVPDDDSADEDEGEEADSDEDDSEGGLLDIERKSEALDRARCACLHNQLIHLHLIHYNFARCIYNRSMMLHEHLPCLCAWHSHYIPHVCTRTIFPSLKSCRSAPCLNPMKWRCLSLPGRSMNACEI